VSKYIPGTDIQDIELAPDTIEGWSDGMYERWRDAVTCLRREGHVNIEGGTLFVCPISAADAAFVFAPGAWSCVRTYGYDPDEYLRRNQAAAVTEAFKR
jgi:hypothetical protein